MDTTNLKVYLPFDTSATADLTGGAWTATSNLEIEKHALKFYANGQYVSRDGGITLGGKDFTISCKANMRLLSEKYASIFSFFQTENTNNNKIAVERDNMSNTQLRLVVSNGTANFNCLLGEEHHIELDYLHSLSKLLVFVDGVLIITKSSITINETAFASCWVGKSNYTNGSAGSFVGTIDEFIIYDGVALHDADFTPPTDADYAALKLALGARAYLTTDFDVETRVHNGLKGWRYYNPGYGERLKTGGTTIQTDSSVTGVAFYGGQQSDMFWSPDGLKEIWMRFDYKASSDPNSATSALPGGFFKVGQMTVSANGISVGMCSRLWNVTRGSWMHDIILPNDKKIYLTRDGFYQILLHMVSGAIDGLFDLTINNERYYYTCNINDGNDFNNLVLYSTDPTAYFSNVVISQTPITIEDGWHIDSLDVESKITAPVLNLRARGETHKFKLHTKKSKPANAISVAGKKFYGKFVAATDDNAGVIRARYDDANYALSKT